VCALAVVALGGCAMRRPGRPFAPPPDTGPTPWHGYDRFDFAVGGRHCIVVRPEHVAPGTPWVWRATFFEERPEVELALLARGFHVAYMEVTDLCGSPTAVALWDEFYRYLTESQGFAARPALTAISRGGLITYNWAAAHPDRVACIYADIAVCDFKSWPGGKGTGPGDAGEWRRCLDVYGFDEAQALVYGGNPADNLAPLADAGVPLLHAAGDADRLVPFDENTGLLVRRYRALGGDVDVIVKPHVGHVPGVDDPTPVIEFIASHAE
jgi:pimeloyl-ACP methyl ester carboxylesterase